MQRMPQIRSERRSNNGALLGLLQAEAKRVAGQAQSGGGGDQAAGSATKRRARLCIPVRANMKSLLPGCIVLDTSNTGATLFVEPAGACSEGKVLVTSNTWLGCSAKTWLVCNSLRG